jgi:hypothetical protein
MRVWMITAMLVVFLIGCTRHPALISRVPSIEIALGDAGAFTVLSRDHDARHIGVLLHNVSSRGVVAYVLSDDGDPEGGIAWSREKRGTRGHPSIAPRCDSREELFKFGEDGRAAVRGFGKLPARPERIVVAAAIFSDGSHEGDVHVAAKLEGQQIGMLILYRLIKPIIDHFVQDRSMDDEVRMTRIKDAIFRISSQPEDGALRTLESQFPNLPRQEAIVDLADALDAAKNDLWGDLYGYMTKCCQYPPSDHISLANWWRMRDRSL